MSRFALLALLGLAAVADAHMQLAYPYPYNSPLNSNTPEASKDYSMTSPLVNSGIYPCKGYLGTADQGPRPSWTAGETVKVSLAGTAVHGGGSCQFGLSYDNGNNFFVIKSFMGGCPSVTSAFDVEIPANAPTGDGVIFSWSWFNKVGNREMYMNCLSANIKGTASSALSGPTIMVANADVNSCSTTEGTAVVFESPGANVVYMGEYAGLSIGNGLTKGAGVVGSNCYAPGSVGAGNGGGAANPKPAVTSTKQAATSSTKAAVSSSKAASGVVSSAAVTKSAVNGGAGGANLIVKPSSSTPASQAAASKPATTSTKVAATSTKPAATSSKAATTSSKAATTTTSTKAAAATTAAAPASGQCTTGDWKCVGSVLTQCAQSNWTAITDCNLQAGTVCSASTPIGCVWPFQVVSRKRSLADHRAKRRLHAH